MASAIISSGHLSFHRFRWSRRTTQRTPVSRPTPWNAQIVTTTRLLQLPAWLRAKAFCEVLYSPTQDEETDTDSIHRTTCSLAHRCARAVRMRVHANEPLMIGVREGVTAKLRPAFFR